MAFVLVHTFENYRDFEPETSASEATPYGQLSRITLDDDTNRAYGLIANPAATLDNDEELSTGDAVTIPWDEAVSITHAA